MDITNDEREYEVLAKEAIKTYMGTADRGAFIEAMLAKNSRFSRFGLKILWETIALEEERIELKTTDIISSPSI